MTLSAEQMFLTYKRIHPESDAVIATLAAAIYHHVTDNMKLPYNSECRIFINDALAQREITSGPFGKKFNELTKLATHGVSSRPAPSEIDPDDPEMNAIRETIARANDDPINEANGAIDEARWSSQGMGPNVRDKLLKFMMEGAGDGSSQTLLEKMTDVINDAVALSILNDEYRQSQNQRFNVGLIDLADMFGDSAKIFSLNIPRLLPENVLDDAVYDASEELMKDILCRIDFLDREHKAKMGPGPIAPHA